MHEELPPLLRGRRIDLYPLTRADVTETYCGWLNDPEVNRYLECRFHPTSLQRLEAYVAQCQGDRNQMLSAIIVRDAGRHIGNIKLGPIDRVHRFADVGLMLGERSFWRQGFGTEAIQVLAAYSFAELGLHKLTAGCYAPNLGSQKAFLKAGFSVEGIRRRHYWLDGDFVDGILMAMWADTARSR